MTSVRRRRAAWVLLGLLALPLAQAGARQTGPGPGPPIFPLPGQKDRALYEKAARLQAGMWFHLSPEGVLVYTHRQGAGPEQLSHDATHLSDVAIWTGCYAASQACRWFVTRDPDALEEVRVLARGMATLVDVTGVPGCLVRNVGRPISGEIVGEGTEPSPKGDGLWFKGDVSRDQLAGITLGWALIAKYVEDPEIRAILVKQAPAIARRLHDSGMWLRDMHDQRTKYGELRPDVEGVPLLKNGGLAAIGLAPILVGAAVLPETGLWKDVERLKERGWSDALSEQHTFLAGFVTASNVNMVNLGLLACALFGDDLIRGRARRGLEELRVATVGWWNGGYCACQLLGGVSRDVGRIVAELRRTLHDMTDLEAPPGQETFHDLDRIATITEHGPQGWTWADYVRRSRTFCPWPAGVVPVTHTRADFLFAYWLARAAGYLQPLAGPGSRPHEDHVAMRLPPWMQGGNPR